MNNRIIIHWDGTANACIYKSYTEVNNILRSDSEEVIYTHCLEFFSQGYNAIAVKNDGSFIDVQDLMCNDGTYTVKEIRESHNIRKMLVAGVLNWSNKGVSNGN